MGRVGVAALSPGLTGQAVRGTPHTPLISLCMQYGCIHSDITVLSF